jgi:hypothetical protein
MTVSDYQILWGKICGVDVASLRPHRFDPETMELVRLEMKDLEAIAPALMELQKQLRLRNWKLTRLEIS